MNNTIINRMKSEVSDMILDCIMTPPTTEEFKDIKTKYQLMKKYILEFSEDVAADEDYFNEVESKFPNLK